MTYTEIIDQIKMLPLEEKVKLRDSLRYMILLQSEEEKARRQAHCPHSRAKTSDYVPGMVTWYCPDCHLTRQEAHHRERGTQ